MSPQACLNVCKRSCKWRLLTRQELCARSEDRIILMKPDFFCPLYVPTIWIFLRWKSFVYISPCHKHCPGENETAGEQEKWGFLWSDPDQLLLRSQRVVLIVGPALWLLLLHSWRNNWRQLFVNVHPNFLLSLSPWYSSALAALSDTLEYRNSVMLCYIKYL